MRERSDELIERGVDIGRSSGSDTHRMEGSGEISSDPASASTTATESAVIALSTNSLHR